MWILIVFAAMLYLLGIAGSFSFMVIAEDESVDPCSPWTLFSWSLVWPVMALMLFVAVVWGLLQPEPGEYDDSNCGSEN